MPHEIAVLACSVYTMQPYTMSLHAKPHIHKVYACLAVTCHLHFWQNDRDLLRATAVTMGWNGYRNKSQHRKLTLEKKIIPPLLQGLEPATFQSWVSNHSCRDLNLLPFNHEYPTTPAGTWTCYLSIMSIQPLLQGLEPATFQSWVWHSNHGAFPAIYIFLSQIMYKTEEK